MSPALAFGLSLCHTPPSVAEAERLCAPPRTFTCHTQSGPAMPRLSVPAHPCHALTCQSVPCLACRVSPQPDLPGQLLIRACLPCFASSRLSAPHHALPRLPCLTAPRLTLPCDTMPAVPHHAKPKPAAPRLPFHVTLGLALPRLCLSCLPGPDSPIRAVPRHVPSVQARRSRERRRPAHARSDTAGATRATPGPRPKPAACARLCRRPPPTPAA
jgi:hypothetical protein